MSKRSRIPCALTVAGSDSGGGAGVQADLKTFAAHRVHGVCAITCLTAQNPEAILGTSPCSTTLLRQQLEAVAPFKPTVMKTGMLYSRGLIEVVQAFLDTHPKIKLIIDPVMVATSGANLLKPSAVSALKRLLPRAALITPNIPEAEAISGKSISEIEDQRQVARVLSRRFECAVLIKGGHMGGPGDIADIFFDGKEDYLLTAPHIRGVGTHGTGCTLSAAIAANLTLNHPLNEAVFRAKEFITGAIAGATRTASFDVLNPFWE